MSRGFIDEKTNSLIAAFRYPGRIGFLGKMDLSTGKLTPLSSAGNRRPRRCPASARATTCAGPQNSARRTSVPWSAWYTCVDSKP